MPVDAAMVRSPILQSMSAALSMTLPIATIVSWASIEHQSALRDFYFATCLLVYTTMAFTHWSLTRSISAGVCLAGLMSEMLRIMLEGQASLSLYTLPLSGNLFVLYICSHVLPTTRDEQRQGSCANYRLLLRVFLPLLWPADDLPYGARLAGLALLLAAQRVVEVLVPWQLGKVIEHAEGQDYASSPWLSVALYIPLQWLQSPVGIRRAREYAILPVQQSAQRRIAHAAFSHILDLDMYFHMSKDSTEVIRSAEQAEEIGELFEFALCDCIPLICDLGIAFVLMYALVDGYVLLIIVNTALLSLLVSNAYAPVTAAKQRTYAQDWRRMHQAQADVIMNFDPVLRLHQQHHECSRYRATVQRYHASQTAYFWSFLAGLSGHDTVVFIGQAAALCWGFHAVQERNTTLSGFVTLCTVLTRIGAHLASVQKFLRKGTRMFMDAERLAEIMETTPLMADAPGADPLQLRQGRIDFDQVSFTYPGQQKPALHQVSLTIHPGQTVAIVGTTGAGKTTMANLLGRFFRLDSGKIRIDHQDISAVSLGSVRRAIGWVSQDCTVFNKSILENVRYGRLDASDDDVKLACHKASIHARIESLSEGYHTQIGERGVKLSGGERQKLTIARLLLNDHRIVVLDEATSALDTETENVIKTSLQTHFAGKTVMIIAHRLSTIREAHKIVVLHQGAIVECGGHDELLKKCGRYATLWKEQTRGLPQSCDA